MMELKQTGIFRKWRTKLKDKRARAAIALRLARLAYGHAGDVEPVGQGISELASITAPAIGYISRAWRYDHRLALWWRQKHAGQGYQDRQAPRG